MKRIFEPPLFSKRCYSGEYYKKWHFIMNSYIVYIILTCISVRPNFALAQDYTYLGCFYDNNRREALPDLIYCERDIYPYDTCQNTCGPQAQYCQSQEMTIELCIYICADQNMRYFGIQAGSQCLCGGFFAPYNFLGQPDGNDTCNRNCSGNSSQLCGADFQASVYQINESPSDCFNPGYVLNGDQSQQDSSLYNASDVIDFAPVCPPPSIKDGAASITCTPSGNWTNTPPTCTIRCATPTAPMYASFSPWQTLNNNYAVDDEVFFDCDMDPSRTNQTLTCGYYGDWETLASDCPETPPPTTAATPNSASTTAITISTPTTATTTTSTPKMPTTGATATSQGAYQPTSMSPFSLNPPSQTSRDDITSEPTIMMTSSDGGRGSSLDTTPWIIAVVVLSCALLVFAILFIFTYRLVKRSTNPSSDMRVRHRQSPGFNSESLEMAKPVPYDTAIIKTGSAHQVNESSGNEYTSDAGDMKEHAYEALEGRPANFVDKDFTC
ncbi:uncharacterized protein LOC135157253 [Lytechinus pictus]|uniref:uncharacterized protein LOC135157253 n=1 Tax=Lytechinus pictus TaxID=7653 RepID=UPI0030B9B4A4